MLNCNFLILYFPETLCGHSVTDCFLTMQGNYLASEAGYALNTGDTGQTLEGTMPAGLAACETPRLAISLLVRPENPVATDEEENAPRRLFPNPTTGMITLDGLPAGQLDVHLFSMSGQSLGQLFRGRHDGKSRFSLQLPDIPSGL